MLIAKFKSYEDLKEHALGEVQKALETGKTTVDILLYDGFPEVLEKIQKVCNKFKIKEISDDFRSRFKDYNIKSIVGCKGKIQAIVTFEKGPCVSANVYPLVWTLTLTKK